MGAKRTFRRSYAISLSGEAGHLAAPARAPMRENAPDSLDGSRLRRVLGQRQVCSDVTVVMRVRAQHMTKMTIAEHDHMIKAFASDRADQSFGIAVLPW
jgi:hypothetical protein